MASIDIKDESKVILTNEVKYKNHSLRKFFVKSMAILCSLSGFSILSSSISYSHNWKNTTKNTKNQTNNPQKTTNFESNYSSSNSEQTADASVFMNGKITTGVISYTINNDVLIITSSNNLQVKNPSFKDVIHIGNKDYHNIQINNGAFRYCTQLTESLTFSNSITSIGEDAFSNCTSLTSVDLSQCTNLSEIGDWAFVNCSSLTSVDLSQCTNLSSIGYGAFSECTRLTSIDLSECTNLTSIGIMAFFWCTNLTSVDFPTSLTSIGGNAFQECKSLTSIDLSQCISLASISSNTFAGCTNLTSVDFPTSLTSIGNGAFWCNNLTSVDLSQCTNLSSISDLAFQNCGNLTGTLTLPNSLTSIGSDAFDGCNNITEIHLNWTAEQLPSLNLNNYWLGNLNNENMTIVVPFDQKEYYESKKDKLGINECKIVENQKMLCSSWINNAEGELIVARTNQDYISVESVIDIKVTNPLITNKININGQVNTINKLNDNQFVNQDGINGTVTIDSSITAIGDNAFNGCNNINSFVLSWHDDNLPISNISQYWLGNLNRSSTTIIVPNYTINLYVTNAKKLGIDKCVIKTINSYTSISSWIDGKNVAGDLYYQINNLNLEISNISNVAAIDPKIKSQIILDGGLTYKVNKINSKLFSDNNNLTGNLTIEEGISAIGDNAFSNCKGLKDTLNIPSSIKNIGSNAFYNCPGIQKICLNWDFNQINNLLINNNWLGELNNKATIVIVPAEDINSYLSNAVKLGIDKCTIEPSSSIDASLWIKQAVNGTMDVKLFNNGTSKNAYITSVNGIVANDPIIDSSLVINKTKYDVKTINNNLFENQVGLIGNLTINDGIDTIGENAFNNCINLEGRIILPSSIKSIGANAFNGCNEINNIQLNWNSEQLNEIVLDKNWLGNLNNSNTNISVPIDYIKDYVNNLNNLGIDQCKIEADLPSGLWISQATGTIRVILNNSDHTFEIVDASHLVCDNPTFDNKIEIGNVDYTISKIDDNAFKDNHNLTGILTINNTITSFGKNVFAGCENIIGIHLCWTSDQVNEIIKNKSLDPTWLGDLNRKSIPITIHGEYIDAYTYNQIDLGIDKCDWIDDQIDLSLLIDGAVGQCWLDDTTECVKIHNVELTDKLENGVLKDTFISTKISGIAAYAFANEINLYGNFTIPNTITNIDEGAFNSCPNLKSITLNWTKEQLDEWFSKKSNITDSFSPINIGWLGDSNKSSIKIIVPKSLEKTYIKYAKQLGIDKCQISDTKPFNLSLTLGLSLGIGIPLLTAVIVGTVIGVKKHNAIGVKKHNAKKKNKL